MSTWFVELVRLSFEELLYLGAKTLLMLFVIVNLIAFNEVSFFCETSSVASGKMATAGHMASGSFAGGGMTSSLYESDILLNIDNFLQVVLNVVFLLEEFLFNNGGFNLSCGNNWFGELFVGDDTFVLFVYEAFSLLVDDVLIFLVNDFLFLLVDDGLVNFVNVLLMDDWLMEFMNYFLMQLINYVLMLFSYDIFVMFMNHILMFLFDDWGNIVSLHNWSLMVLSYLSLCFHSVYNRCFLVSDNNSFSGMFVNNWSRFRHHLDWKLLTSFDPAFLSESLVAHSKTFVLSPDFFLEGRAGMLSTMKVLSHLGIF